MFNPNFKVSKTYNYFDLQTVATKFDFFSKHLKLFTPELKKFQNSENTLEKKNPGRGRGEIIQLNIFNSGLIVQLD